MKALFVVMICLVVFACPSGLYAVLIQHNGTNVFEEDFEEGYGPGFSDPRDPIPWIGAWSISGLVTNIQVLAEAYDAGQTQLPVGGASQGLEYLKVSKIGSGGEPKAQDFDITGGTIHIAFMCYIPYTDGWNDGAAGLASFILSEDASLGGSSTTTLFWINANRSGNELKHYWYPSWGNADILKQGTSTPMTWTPNVWQKWEFDYTFVPGDLTNDTVVLTLDGQASEPMRAWSDDRSARYLTFRPNGGFVDNVFHLDATVPENKPRLLGHYDFEEDGGGPWAQVTDKAGPVYYTHAGDIGGGSVNLAGFNGGYGLNVDSNVNNAIDLGQGSGNEFDIDCSAGLSVEATFTFTNENLAGYIACKRGAAAAQSAWYLQYFGPSGNVSLSNTVNFAVFAGSSGYNRTGPYKITPANRDHRWYIRGDYVPAADQIKVTMIDLDTGAMLQDVTPTVPLSLNRVASIPVVLGARGNHATPFPGTIDSVKIFAEGDPPIPKIGTIISVR